MRQEKSIIKYNQTVQISNGLSFLARKCWNILISKVFKEIYGHRKKYQNSIYNFMIDDGYTFDEMKQIEALKDICINTMELTEVLKQLDITTRNQEYLKKVITDLMHTTVEFNLIDEKGKKSWGASTLLSACEIREGKIKYEFSSYLMDKLLLAEQYTRINLSIQRKMTNKYSLALYENCKNWHDPKKEISYSPKLTILDLRKLIVGDIEKYPLYKEFNRYILSKAIKQVNEVSDLVIKKKDFKEMKEVKFIQFMIMKKSNEQKKDDKQKINTEILGKYEKRYKDGIAVYNTFTGQWKDKYSGANIDTSYYPELKTNYL